MRRIGRLPGDKALEIARQLCAGLAAAHDAGVLHRDLKPANVMLDGRGRVRITDFGLAVAAERARDDEVLAGTPPYMSPEQLTGKPLTPASDLYALGLVLYEVFTGRRAFDAGSLAEYVELHQSATPASPSSLGKDLDPLVERVILQCLEKEPRKRPASALQVSAALPGGEPLQAALAAGETPSPEMVAASGEKAGVRPVVALVCLGAIAVGLIAVMVLGGKASLLDVTLDNPPVVLMRQARAVGAQLGYPERPFDTSYGVRVDTEYLRHIDQAAGPAEPSRRLASARPLAVLFWYRESPDFLRSVRAGGGGRVTPDDPPQDTPGMIALRFDAAGRLRQFDAVPPLLDEDAAGPTGIDWKLPFVLAGLDISTFAATTPQLIPPDTRMTRRAPGPGRIRISPLRPSAWRPPHDAARSYSSRSASRGRRRRGSKRSAANGPAPCSCW